MKYRIFLLCVVFASVMLPGSILADEPVYTAYTEELEPVNYTSHGKIVGIGTEIVQAVCAEAGITAKFVSFPWKRTYYYALHHENSLVFTINRTPEREQLFEWIGPILSKRTYLYRLKSRSDIKVTKPEDLQKYITAVILGYALTEKLQNMGLQPEKQLIIKTSKKEQIHVFLSQRADLITGNEFTLPKALQGTGLTINDLVPVLLMNEKGYYLAANRSIDPQILHRLRAANDKIQKSGLVHTVIEKYMQ